MKALITIGILSATWVLNAQAETIRVGIKETPPFAMLNDQGEWTGISVELWNGIAEQLEWQTEWVVLSSPRAQIDALVADTADIGLGALSISAEREALIDFSSPFFSTGLAIAAPLQSGSGLAVVKRLVSPKFLSAVGLLTLVLLAVGALLWLVEHKRNPNQFGGSAARGIGSGFWWSAVTMTTVGYGDKAPVTTAGRVVATIWMFASIITISGFTAGIASSITVNQLSAAVGTVEDLARVRTIAVEGSIGEDFLRSRGIGVQTVRSPQEGLEMLRAGSAAALVHDEPLLRYLLRDADPGVEVLPQLIEPQYYAIGLRSGFEHREALNRTLLALVGDDDWQRILNRYLGAR